MPRTSLQAPKPLIKHIEQPTKTTFWGQPYVRRAAMVREVLGDGGQLVMIAPLAARPNYYGVLVHSTWTEDDIAERLEIIYRAIEDSFGSMDDELEDGEEARWPALSSDGCHYRLLPWPTEKLQAAVLEDLDRQRKEQNAYFIGEHRIHPGTLLLHPEFGTVQVRLNSAIGWHYCRGDTWHEFRPGDVGYATDMARLSLLLDAGGELTHRLTGINRTITAPVDPALDAAPAPRRRPTP